MMSFAKFFIAGLLVMVFAACGSTAAEEVEQSVVGTWVMHVPGPVGNSVWVWAIRGDGTYEFQIEGLGFPPGHKGKMTAANGKWTLTSTTMDYADGGTYEMPDPNTFLATGRLGPGRWSRHTPVPVVQQDQKATQQVAASSNTPADSQNSVMDTLIESLSLDDPSTKSGSANQSDINAYLLGLDALETGRWNEAIQQFTTAIQTKPENPDYLTARGVAYALAQQLKSAEKDLRRANQLRANHKPTKMWLATVVGMQGRFSEDQGIYPFATLDEYENTVRRMSHEYGELFFSKAMGDELAVRQARPAHDQAIQSFPALAKMFVDRAKPAGSRATGGPRGGLSTALRQRGIDRYKAGQCAEGYRDLSHAYQADPDDKEILFYLAECKLKLGSPEGARADYTAVLLDQPNHAKAIVGRALAHAVLGDALAAQQGLVEAHAIDRQLASQYEKQVKKDLANWTSKPSEQQKVALLEQLRKSAQQGAKWKTLIQLAEQVVKVSQHGRLRADEQYQIKLTELRRATNRRNATADDFTALGQFLYDLNFAREGVILS